MLIVLDRFSFRLGQRTFLELRGGHLVVPATPKALLKGRMASIRLCWGTPCRSCNADEWACDQQPGPADRGVGGNQGRPKVRRHD